MKIFVEMHTQLFFEVVPQQPTLDNLKNKIKTLISNLCFEICPIQMNGRSWKRC
jgi:hypothetical protein